MLVTLQQAADHLRVDLREPDGPVERDILMKAAQAEAIILDYLKVAETSPPLWDEDTVPVLIQAAILAQLMELWALRGDNQKDGPRYEDGQLSPFVTSILRRYRDPALA